MIIFQFIVFEKHSGFKSTGHIYELAMLHEVSNTLIYWEIIFFLISEHIKLNYF